MAFSTDNDYAHERHSLARAMAERQAEFEKELTANMQRMIAEGGPQAQVHRLECLKLAVGVGELSIVDGAPIDSIELARQFYKFVQGSAPEPQP